MLTDMVLALWLLMVLRAMTNAVLSKQTEIDPTKRITWTTSSHSK